MTRPLRIMVTQGEGAAGTLARRLAARGANILPVPAIAFEPPDDPGPLDRALEEIERFDWIVFTSRHAVEAVVARPAWSIARGRSHPGLRVAAVGRATARALAEAGATVDLLPEEAGGQALAALMTSLPPSRPNERGLEADDTSRARRRTEPQPDAVSLDSRPTGGGMLGGRPSTGGSLSSQGVAGDRPGTEPSPGGPSRRGPVSRGSTGAGPLAGVRVLWPRSDIALRELPEAVRAAGAELVEPIAYRTVQPAGPPVAGLAGLLESGGIDAVAFMSPSSARNLAAILGWSDLTRLPGRCLVASIGPTTSAALRELGAPPAVESAARTADDLAESLLSYLETREGRS